MSETRKDISQVTGSINIFSGPTTSLLSSHYQVRRTVQLQKYIIYTSLYWENTGRRKERWSVWSSSSLSTSPYLSEETQKDKQKNEIQISFIPRKLNKSVLVSLKIRPARLGRRRKTKVWMARRLPQSFMAGIMSPELHLLTANSWLLFYGSLVYWKMWFFFTKSNFSKLHVWQSLTH